MPNSIIWQIDFYPYLQFNSRFKKQIKKFLQIDLRNNIGFMFTLLNLSSNFIHTLKLQ